ncbi:MAG: ATP-binding protein [Bacteroidetes bacterium]|nr:ATP-binding protein [Bacteroidota bacterium]
MTHEIVQLMQKLKLTGMQASFQGLVQSKNSSSLGNDEFINLLLQAEWEERENKKISRRLQSARFRYRASMEEIDYITPRGLDRTYLMRFTDASFVKKGENIMITGATGVGKSYIATALGHQACLFGYRTIYYSAQKLFAMLKMSKADESYIKEIKQLEKQDLLIIDDFGMQPLDQNMRMMLMEIIEDRHQEKSTIIASQIPVGKWHEIIGESTIADAILDRLVHTAHRIELNGDSLRKKKN